jgi:hypothetical protein
MWDMKRAGRGPFLLAQVVFPSPLLPTMHRARRVLWSNCKHNNSGERIVPGIVVSSVIVQSSDVSPFQIACAYPNGTLDSKDHWR